MIPEIKELVSDIPYSNLERSLEIVSLGGLILMLYLILSTYSSLPDTMPHHFGIDGKPDAYGPKKILMILPLVSIFLFALLTVAEKFPHIGNYPYKITTQNAVRQVSLARKLILSLKAEIIWLFLYIEWAAIQTGLGRAAGLGVWFFGVFMILIFGTLIVYLRMAFLAR